MMRSLFFVLANFLLPFTAFSQNLTATKLPIVNIDTDGWLIFDEPKINATMTIIAHENGKENHPTDPPNIYKGPIGIELRGKTSQLMSEKKPYGVELRDKNGENNDQSILGMPPENDWIMLAPYSDKSLIRDMYGFAIARRFNNLDYVPRTQYTEVIINEEYKGLYIWCEKIKWDENRVSLKKWQKKDESGAFMFKIDKESGFLSDEFWTSHVPAKGANNSQDIRYLYQYPKPTEITPKYMQYMQHWMYAMEDTLLSTHFADTTGGGYRQFIDTRSFIDFMLVNELCRNVDGYRISSYFHKNSDEIDPRLHAGPVWDFNLAFGNANYCHGERTDGWAWDFNKVCGSDYWLIPFWWERLRQDPAYCRQTRERWQALRTASLSDKALSELIDELAAPLAEGPAARNFAQWQIMGIPIWPNSFVGKTWEEELDYLRRWTIARAQWMDEAVKGL
jgi:hypothetical protein